MKTLSNDMFLYNLVPYMDLGSLDKVASTCKKYDQLLTEIIQGMYKVCLKTHFPEDYSWMRVAYKENRGWKKRYMSLIEIETGEKRLQLITRKVQTMEKISMFACGVSSVCLFVQVSSVLGKIFQNNWISNYLKNHPDASLEDAMKAYLEYLKELNQDLTDSIF